MLYRKIPVGFVSSFLCHKITEYNTEALKVALYLLTAPDSTLIGIYPITIELIAFHTKTPEKEVKNYLSLLQKIEFCSYSENSKYIWVHDMAKYNSEDNIEEYNREYTYQTSQPGGTGEPPSIPEAIYQIRKECRKIQDVAVTDEFVRSIFNEFSKKYNKIKLFELDGN